MDNTINKKILRNTNKKDHELSHKKVSVRKLIVIEFVNLLLNKKKYLPFSEFRSNERSAAEPSLRDEKEKVSKGESILLLLFSF